MEDRTPPPCDDCGLGPAPLPAFKLEPEFAPAGGFVEIWRLRPDAAIEGEYEWFAECAAVDGGFAVAALLAAHKREQESEIG